MVSHTLQLRDYQLVAKDWLHGRPKSGVFLDMGLGKSASVLAALEPEHLPCLVIAPKRVAENTWPEEGEIWRPDLKVVCANGGPGERHSQLRDTTADVVALSRNNIKDLLTAAKDGPKWKTLVIDESTGYKSQASTSFKVAKAFIKFYDPAHIWLLTGSPSPEGLMDLWSQIYLLDKGERLGTGITQFRSRYFTPGWKLPNGAVTSWDPLPGAFEEVMSRIQDICIYMETDGRVELPGCTHNPIYVDLPQESLRLYRSLKKKRVAEYTGLIGDISKKVIADTPGALSGKLEQIAQGVMFDQDRLGNPTKEFTVLHREKIIAAKEIVESITSPVIMLYKYRPELEILQSEFGDKAHSLVGRDSTEVIKAWNRGDVPIMLAHPASMSHGLNLQHGGHHMVWEGLQWPLELWEQANKRLDRSGQQHPVVIHRIMARKTIDEAIFARLEGKADWQQMVKDHLESPL